MINFRKSKTSFILNLCVFICITSSVSIVHCSAHGSLEPLDVFFYDVQPPRTISIQSVESKKMACPNLKVDQSCLIIQSNIDKIVKFQYQSLECENCTLIDNITLNPHESREKVLDFASLGTVWKVSDEDNNSICGLQENYFGENSSYHLYVNATGCTLVCDQEPEHIYIPILIAFGFYLLLAVVWIICSYVKRTELISRLFQRDSLDDLAAAYSSSTTIEEKKPKTSSQRLRSLDTVRGISIVVMIFVNYGGGKYEFFDHSYWNGLTVADLVFPWFMWMMGMSMCLSLRSQLRKVVSRRKIFCKILKRSLILFALGIMLNTTCTLVDLSKLRIPGVLQRFAISYFVVASVHLFYASADDTSESSSVFRDLVPYGGEWLVMLSLLTLHLLLTFLVHSPECPRSYLGPGGRHHQGAYSSCTGGAAGYIDRMLLGSNHLYQKPSFKAIYDTSLPYDPEGILGYLTSIFLVFLGLQAGKILLTYKESKSRMLRWVIWGLALGAVAALLCKGSKNDGWIPVNKNLWSVSFILSTGSLAFLLLTTCYFLCDVQKWWSGAPFYQAGMNSIVLYLGHSVLHHMFPFSWRMPSTHTSLLFMDLWGATLWVIIALYMHHKNTFISV